MSWLHMVPFAPLAALIAGSLLGALELGHQLGRRSSFAEGQATTVAGSSLALVGLLLAFSFSMAGERHAARRAAAVDEVNAIGTLWLRTSLVEEPARSEMQTRLRRYVDLHLEHREAGTDHAKLKAIEATADRLQREIWAIVMRDARGALEPTRLRLIVSALNETFDATATLVAAGENRLPDAIVLYLFVLVITAGVVVGYRPRHEGRNLVSWIMFTVIVSGVTVILLDLDRPRRGFVQTDSALYVRLRESMRENPP
jgi:hypothetical protein